MSEKDKYSLITDQLASAPAEALDELVSLGAQGMLMADLEAEVSEYLQLHHREKDENGHSLVVRDGRAVER